jgi:hypothetical protein
MATEYEAKFNKEEYETVMHCMRGFLPYLEDNGNMYNAAISAMSKIQPKMTEIEKIIFHLEKELNWNDPEIEGISEKFNFDSFSVVPMHPKMKLAFHYSGLPGQSIIPDLKTAMKKLPNIKFVVNHNGSNTRRMDKHEYIIQTY